MRNISVDSCPIRQLWWNSEMETFVPIEKPNEKNRFQLIQMRK